MLPAGVAVKSLGVVSNPSQITAEIGGARACVHSEGPPMPASPAPPPPVPEAAVPEVAVPEAAVPEAAVPEAAVPDVAVPEAAVPDVAVPEAAVPDVAVPEAAVPDAAIPEAAVPDVAVPEAAVPVVPAPLAPVTLPVIPLEPVAVPPPAPLLLPELGASLVPELCPDEGRLLSEEHPAPIMANGTATTRRSDPTLGDTTAFIVNLSSGYGPRDP